MTYYFENTRWECLYQESNELLKRSIEVLSSWNTEEQSYVRSVYIYIQDAKVSIVLNRRIWTYSGISSSDIYPILYSVIYYICMMNKHVALHSVAVNKSKTTLLIIGAFGAGKSTLAQKLETLNWRIVSYDQTILAFTQQDTVLIAGSKLQCINDIRTLHMNHTNRYYSVSGIVHINGLCEGGKVSIIKTNSFNSVYRRTWDSFMWPWNTPLTNKKLIIPVEEYCYVNWVLDCYKHFSLLPFNKVRGDPDMIARAINTKYTVLAPGDISQNPVG